MTIIRVKGFKIYHDRLGRKRCYHRATGTPIDLTKIEFGSEAFFAECARLSAIKQAVATKPGTIGLLTKEYKKSAAYQQLAPKTKEFYESAFKFLEPIADTPLTAFDRPLVVRIRDKAQDRRGYYFANQLKTTISALFSWGVERGYMKENTAKGVKALKRPKDLPRANRPWSDKERFAVLDYLPAHIMIPIAIIMYTGMDPCDAVALRKNQFDGNAIEYARQKNGNPVWLPVPIELKGLLAKSADHLATTLAANSYGKPWTKSGLDSVWIKLRTEMEEKGLVAKGLTLKGLRHTKATILREIGFDKRAIADSLAQDAESMGGWYSRDAKLDQKMQEMTTAFDIAEREKRAAYLSNKKQKGV